MGLKGNKMLEIYGKSYCGWCTKAVEIENML